MDENQVGMGFYDEFDFGFFFMQVKGDFSEIEGVEFRCQRIEELLVLVDGRDSCYGI